jgi:Chaperone of endosialidase
MAVGSGALGSNTGGSENTATGSSALFLNTTGSTNTAVGSVALVSNRGGSSNTAVGRGALGANTEGTFNIALGFQAGQQVTTGGHNIHIGNTGSALDDNAIRIGTIQTDTSIAGIFGATAANGAAVFVASNGKLGTVNSSARFKDDIKPMDKASASIFALRPVTFRYKRQIDAKGTPQFGLVAEEVEAINPDLVVRDKEGKPYSVRYDQVNAMLLNEFLKEHRRNEQQEATIAQLKKEMETVVARLKEHDSKIQRVNARIEISKAVGQTALNDQ